MRLGFAKCYPFNFWPCKQELYPNFSQNCILVLTHNSTFLQSMKERYRIYNKDNKFKWGLGFSELCDTEVGVQILDIKDILAFY